MSLCDSCKHRVLLSPSAARCGANAPAGALLAEGREVARCGVYEDARGRKQLTDRAGRIDPRRE